ASLVVLSTGSKASRLARRRLSGRPLAAHRAWYRSRRTSSFSVVQTHGKIFPKSGCPTGTSWRTQRASRQTRQRNGPCQAQSLGGPRVVDESEGDGLSSHFGAVDLLAAASRSSVVRPAAVAMPLIDSASLCMSVLHQQYESLEVLVAREH